MRESLSYGMFPLLQENMDVAMFNPGYTSLISSNGYYGYQPQIHPPNNGSAGNGNQEQATSDKMEMDLQRDEVSDVQMQVENERRDININRKRRLEEHVAETREFKKRRDDVDNNASPSLPPQQLPVSTPQVAHMRRPTHNLPDVPRCLMGHYV